MSIKIPERPKQPDYTSILKKELSRIGDFSLEDDFNKRMKLERKWDKNEKRGIGCTLFLFTFHLRIKKCTDKHKKDFFCRKKQPFCKLY